jgi:predicted DNA-binding transcriptional regulator AlpA
MELDRLCNLWGVSRSTVYNHLKSGWDPNTPMPLHPGRKPRVPQVDVNAVMRQWRR